MASHVGVKLHTNTNDRRVQRTPKSAATRVQGLLNILGTGMASSDGERRDSSALSRASNFLRRMPSNISSKNSQNETKQQTKSDSSSFSLPILETSIDGSFSNIVSESLAQRGVPSQKSSTTLNVLSFETYKAQLSESKKMEIIPWEYEKDPNTSMAVTQGPTNGLYRGTTSSLSSLNNNAQKRLHSYYSSASSSNREIVTSAISPGILIQHTENGRRGSLGSGEVTIAPLSKISSEPRKDKFYGKQPLYEDIQQRKSMNVLRGTITCGSRYTHSNSLDMVVDSPPSLHKELTSRTLQHPHVPSRRSSLRYAYPEEGFQTYASTVSGDDLSSSPPSIWHFPPPAISVFEPNTSEDELHVRKHKSKGLNRKKGKNQLNEKRHKGEKLMDPAGTSAAIQYAKLSYCVYGCKRPRCFHDCDVLHIKNALGGDSLVLEAVEKRPMVVAGTVDGLILELIRPLDDRSDESFTDLFLRSAPVFMSNLDLLNSLINHFKEINKRIRQAHSRENYDVKAVKGQERIICIIARWLRIQPDDLLENILISSNLDNFIDEIKNYHYLKSGYEECKQLLQKVLANRIAYERLQNKRSSYSLRQAVDEIDIQIKAETLNDCGILPLELEVEELAKYFAALDLILFRDASQPRTLRIWTERNSNLPTEERITLVDRVDRILKRRKMIQDWILYELVITRNSSAIHYITTYAIEKFTRLAKRLQELGNFQTSMCIAEILLNKVPIMFGDAFKAVSDEVLPIHRELQLLLNDTNYERALDQAREPVVPCLTRFLHKLSSVGKATKYYNSTTFEQKRHMDLRIDQCEYPYVPEYLLHDVLSTRQNQFDQAIIDLAKHRALLTTIIQARRRCNRAHSFERLGKMAWVFNMYIPGRTAFCSKTVSEPPLRNSHCTDDSIDSAVLEFDNLTLRPNCDMAATDSLEQEITSTLHAFRTDQLPTNSGDAQTRVVRSTSSSNKGCLDWISEPLERRIVEAYVYGVHFPFT